jgi:hypothetical protein
VARIEPSRTQCAPVAGDGEPALRQGQEKLPRQKLVYITPVMRLETLVDPTIALQEPAFSGQLNTAFSERVNLTVRPYLLPPVSA